MTGAPVDREHSEFAQYRRKQIAELRPWVEGLDMAGVSVSDEDKKAGSPKPGDMIARNPKNHADRWLVAHAYFLDNFEPVALPALASEPSGEPDDDFCDVCNGSGLSSTGDTSSRCSACAPPAQPSVEPERESALTKALTDLHAYVEYCKGVEYVPSYNAPEMVMARTVLGIPALIRVAEALEKARRAVAPQVEREREAENIGGLMSLRLTSLLARYSAPCPSPCDHAHCPLLHELNAIVAPPAQPSVESQPKPQTWWQIEIQHRDSLLRDLANAYPEHREEIESVIGNAAPPSEPESQREKALPLGHEFVPCDHKLDKPGQYCLPKNRGECHYRGFTGGMDCLGLAAAHASPSEQRER